MEIKILGTGCPNCITLEKRVKKVVKENVINTKNFCGCKFIYNKIV